MVVKALLFLIIVCLHNIVCSGSSVQNMVSWPSCLFEKISSQVWINSGDWYISSCVAMVLQISCHIFPGVHLSEIYLWYSFLTFICWLYIFQLILFLKFNKRLDLETLVFVKISVEPCHGMRLWLLSNLPHSIMRNLKKSL